MEHRMKLYENPFNKIKSGRSKIEMRLFDEKRQKINLGDIITFSKLPGLNESFSVRVVGLLRYATFRDLVNDFPTNYFGYPGGYDKKIIAEEMYKIYSREDEQKYGVIGIRIELL